MNPTFLINEVESTDTRSKMVIEPLEKGYGHTLGNSLRRVLLTSLPGFAITRIKIDGVDHQYTTLQGLSEDIVELILNIKQVRVKGDGEATGTLVLDVKGEKQVTAGDIECSAGFEISNPDLYIATLAKGKTLKVEMYVEAGMGYEEAEEGKTEYVGEIALDAVYSPVIKVSHKVESTRVGRRTDYDQLVLDVTTDGTVTPLEAVKQAARILAKQFEQIFDPVIPEPEEEEEQLSPEEAETLRLTVEELDLPTRIANALRKGGFKNVGDLVEANKEDVSKVKNLGEKSITIIEKALNNKDVSLKKETAESEE